VFAVGAQSACHKPGCRGAGRPGRVVAVTDAASPSALLHAYDTQLREEAEVPSAVAVERLGPLVLATFLGGRGFISYRHLDVDGRPADEDSVRELVAGALAHYEADPQVVRVEWKTRGHDHAPGLHEALVAHGFTPDEPESVMLGEARLLAVDIDLPEGVVVRQVTEEGDVRAMMRMQAEVFGDSREREAEMAEQILHRLRTRDDMEMWVAEADGQVVSAGRLEPVAGTDFAGLWGGATLPQWRGRGIYRALTAARARSALAHGKRYLNSDSTEFSRPILERAGLVKVSTTTPYEWTRPA
jgi:ribosomal protein S18 acetylase RimI-like enzyme